MRPPSAEEVKEGLGRLTCQEALSLISLPDRLVDGQIIKRYMSRRSAWVPGVDFISLTKEVRAADINTNAYGGHVYGQAAIAASLSLEATQGAASQNGQGKELGIHVSAPTCIGVARRKCVIAKRIHTYNSVDNTWFLFRRWTQRSSLDLRGEKHGL